MQSCSLFSAEDAQYHPQMRNYEDNAKFPCMFLATALRCATLFQRKQGVIENFKYLGKFEKDYWNVGYTVFGIE